MDTHGFHDAFAIKSWDETVIAVLAESLGSHDGRRAAERAVGTLLTNYQNRPRAWGPQKALLEFTQLAQKTLQGDCSSASGLPEPRTSLSIAVLERDRLYGLSMGGAQVYLARKGRLASLVQHRVIESDEPMPKPAINGKSRTEPQFFEAELREGDLAVMCSQAVSSLLTWQVLETQLRQSSAARSIVASAKELVPADYAHDLSAIVLDVKELGQPGRRAEPVLKIPTALAKGQLVDGFTLLKRFQHSDRVWLTESHGQRYTVKFAPVEATESEPLLQLFKREILNATRLSDAGFFPRAFAPESSSTFCYAMEFIEAPNLKSLLSSRKLAVEEAVALARFVLQGAQYLLRFDLVHGDIKPENVLVLQEAGALQFRLVDFGSMTEVFSITSRAGTPTYLAPERFQGSPISERTEIFALGVTLFEALTGSLPFGEIERFQTPTFHAPRRPSQLNANVPPWLDSVLLRALSRDPEGRYQNYSELLFELEHPALVTPYFSKDAPLLERDPLRFYRIGFFVLLVLSIALFILLLRSHANSPIHS